MSIVAISQTLGSLGDEIGRELARVLSYDLVDREIILKAPEQIGEGVTELERLTEGKPSLWERFTETKRRYLAYVAPSAEGLRGKSRAGSRRRCVATSRVSGGC